MKYLLTLLVITSIINFVESVVSCLRFSLSIGLFGNADLQGFTREYSPLKWEQCKLKTPMDIYANFEKSNINKVAYSGYIHVKEEITGELVLVLDTSRCSLDMKKCEKYSNRNFRNMCTRFHEQNKFYTSSFSNISPPFDCPIRPGNYSLGQSSVDLSLFSFLPLDGYIWVVNYRFVSIDEGGKSRRIVMCANSEIKIAKVRKHS